MPLDPNIILANADPSRQFDPMKAMGNALQMKAMQQNVQMQGMQNQQLQQQIQDTQDFRNTFKTAVANGQDPVEALSKSPSPIAQKYLNTILDMRQKGVKLESDQYDLGIKKMQGMGNDILAATSAPGATPQGVAAVVQRHAANGDLPPAQAQEMMQELQTLQGPDALKNWGILQGVKTHVAKDVLGLFTPQTKVSGNVAVTQDALTGKVTGAAPVPGMAASEIGKFAVDLTGKPEITPEVVAKWKELHPNMATVMMGSGGSGGSNFDASQPLKPADESQARWAAKTGQRETPSMRNPGALQRNARAEWLAQNDPNIGGSGDITQNKLQFATAQQAQKYFTTGKGADAFRQQETILHHAQVFSQIADALNNGNVQLANKLGNQFGAQFGSDQATNYKIAGQIFSAEVGKYLAGGQSTAEERKELSELIPSFSSPSQIKGGLATLSALVQGQRQSWLAQRDAALKGNVAFGASQQGPSAPTTPQVMSLADAKATAAASGKTLDQVIQAAKAKGWRIQ